jgi:hypothetical protein
MGENGLGGILQGALLADRFVMRECVVGAAATIGRALLGGGCGERWWTGWGPVGGAADPVAAATRVAEMAVDWAWRSTTRICGIVRDF